MKTLYLFITLFLCLYCVQAQTRHEHYMISGTVKVVITNDTIIPDNAVVELEQIRQITELDSMGFFQFKGIKPGTYKLKVHGYSSTTTDTMFVLKATSITVLNLLVVSNCEVNEEKAKQDLTENKPRLLISGGITPIVYSKQYAFEKKYGVKYFDFGCSAPATECILSYNQYVFEYLDTKYGKKWRQEVRNDVVGL
ncbi:MAG: carboxypeptidase regulatory-like domain-containing protein [Marinilabiliaceae bacterium]|nr:carboxypeptidase regulatory-like domain-containing protein [Marinilabiliaceae bacterium]